MFNQLDRLGRRPAVRMGEVAALGFDHDKRISSHDRLLAIGIALQRFADARCLPFRAGAVEFLRPRCRIVGAIAAVLIAAVAALLDPSRHPM